MRKEQKQKMKKHVLSIIFIFSVTLFSPEIYAITASSPNYSVSMFGLGLQSSNLSSENYKAINLALTQSGTRNALNDIRSANVGFFSRTYPYQSLQIISYAISPKSAPPNSIINLYIFAVNSQSVWAVITLPSGSTQTVALTNNQVGFYIASLVGQYTVKFYANNSLGHIASVVDSFLITSSEGGGSSDSGSGGGSGGGTGKGDTTTIIEKSCTYIWDCTPWSLCAEGKQKRECKNIGTCKGDSNKPEEEISCREALFDIFLKLDSVELTENRKLKLNITLIEVKGAEKIDVHIKYSIINKEGYEIFSQIETRAVEKYLSFIKELSEISLVDGEFKLRVDILYGNLQRAFSEQSIFIKNGKIVEKEKDNFYPIIVLILVAIIFFIIIKERRNKKELTRKAESRARYKAKTKDNIRRIKGGKFIIFILGFCFVIGLLSIKGSKITTLVVNSVADIAPKNIEDVLFILIGLFIAFIIVHIKNIIGIIKKRVKKYKHNSVSALVDKKVYTDSGDYVGVVKEVNLGDNKIDSLKIETSESYREKGIVVNYTSVINVKEIVIVDHRILEKIRKK